MKIPLVMLLVVAAACHSRSRPSDLPVITKPDTLRGIVVLAGSEPGSRTFLDAASGRVELVSTSVHFYQLMGLDVRVDGTQVGNRFDVRDYRVRMARGLPALDGVLGSRSGILYLSLTDGGERLLTNARALPTSMLGARIWLVLSDEGGVTEYGILQEPHQVP